MESIVLEVHGMYCGTPFKDNDKLRQLLRCPPHYADSNLYSYKRYAILGTWITDLDCEVGYTPGKKVLTQAA